MTWLLSGGPLTSAPGRLNLLMTIAAAVVCLLYASPAHAQSAAPTVETVAITSNPGTDNAYATADAITGGVTFSEAVTVTGTPRITLEIGGQRRYAKYTGAGSATGQILFGYSVLAGDVDPNGVSALANSLALSGGTIQATDNSAAVTLTHSATTFANHAVTTAASGTKGDSAPQPGIGIRSDHFTGGVCDRTEEVKVGLVAAASVENCSLVTADKLAEITYLNLNDKGITTLQANDFAGLNKLRWLYLEDNELTLDSFTGGMFSSLPTTIEALTFEGNPGCPTHGNSCFPPAPTLTVGAGAPGDLMVRTGDPVALTAVPGRYRDPLGRSLEYSLTQDSDRLRVLAASDQIGEWYFIVPHVSADEDAAFTLTVTPVSGLWHRIILNNLWKEATDTADLTFLPPPVSSDTSLSALTIDGIDPDYNTSEARYEITVINSVTSVAVNAEASDRNASVVISPDDADQQKPGHQVGVNPGANAITVTVTATDGTTNQVYNVTVTREQTGGVCSRTQQVKEALMDETEVEDCSLVTAVQLAEITYLNLNDKGITTLQANDFAGLNKLRWLYLEDNELTLDSFPGGMFSSLPTTIEALTFEGNPGCPTTATVVSRLLPPSGWEREHPRTSWFEPEIRLC